MKKHFLLLMVAAIAVAFVLPAVANEHHGKSGCSTKMDKMGTCDCMTKLNLTDKQKEEIGNLKKSMMEQKTKQHEEMMKLQASVKEMVNADKPDMAAIEKKIDEQAKLWLKGKKEMIDHMLKVKSLLTPEQLKIWKEHQASCKMGDMDQMKHECKGEGKEKHDCKGETSCDKAGK